MVDAVEEESKQNGENMEMEKIVESQLLDFTTVRPTTDTENVSNIELNSSGSNEKRKVKVNGQKSSSNLACNCECKALVLQVKQIQESIKSI